MLFAATQEIHAPWREIENCIEMSQQFCPGLSKMAYYSKMLYLRNGSSEDSDFWPSYCPFNELSNKINGNAN